MICLSIWDSLILSKLKRDAESFLGESHLRRLQKEAQVIVDDAFRVAGVT